ncbi:fused response regulator/phosphatase [Neobacillus terrae]|uniref:fused response regulator/phosphatase n=1 Tax=Neobacillus terrae TaxID=3034837 RepID=UPI0014084957|nr:fused response regulator/phosphatase [Neobacillus terrae]NHM32667.1 fused response regulator/phosphatase [Neobacillus terrae]
MSIVIVDDNHVNLYLIEKILHRAGYQDYISLTSAQELFDYLQIDSKYPEPVQTDVILMDIMMPEIDGIEACRRLQKIPHLRDIPVIFVTALEDTNKVVEALDVGGIDYIMKPINKVELLARIRVALRLKYEKDWHKEQEEKIRKELDLSMKVQTSLLSEPVLKENLIIKASHLPANKLAGDMYYWYKINDDQYGIILLDMMGHGISASLVCMFINSVLRDAIRIHVDPEAVIKELNRWMAQINRKDSSMHYYFTAIYLIINISKKTVEYVNAGHPPGYILIDNQDVHNLSTGTCAVGFFPEMDVKKTVIHYKEHVQLLLYTDGVMEALEENGEDGLLLLKESASAEWANLKESNPIDYVLPKELHGNQPDDMCVLTIQV